MIKTFIKSQMIFNSVQLRKLFFGFVGLIVICVILPDAMALNQEVAVGEVTSPIKTELKQWDHQQFFAREKALLSALSDADMGNDDQEKIDALIDIAVFYIENQFYEEALFLIENHQSHYASYGNENIESITDIELLKFLSRFYIGHDKDIIEHKVKNVELPLVTALKAISHTNLGQYRVAQQMFHQVTQHFDSLEFLPDNVHITYYLAQLEAAVMVGDKNWISEIRDILPRYELTKNEQDKLVFYTRISVLNDGYGAKNLSTEEYYRALETLTGLSAPYSIFAKLERLKIDLSTHKFDVETALSRLEQLRLLWRGDETERELLLMRAIWSHQFGDLEGAIEDYRTVLKHNPNTDYAQIATQDLRVVMSELFLGESDYPLLEATRIFYANVDLLEPGADGDEQIRDVTHRLTELDLLDEAAELLEHQVFQRLRGHDRAKVAVDLAEISDKNPVDALRVMQSTRITGLHDDVRNRRREIEAQALWHTGRHDRALARLEITGNDRLPLSTLALRARIEADMGDFSKASETFYPVVMNVFQSSKALNRDQEMLILQAISAFAQIGNRSKISEIAQTMQKMYPDQASTTIVVSFAKEGDPIKFYDGYQKWVLASSRNDFNLAAL